MKEIFREKFQSVLEKLLEERADNLPVDEAYFKENFPELAGMVAITLENIGDGWRWRDLLSLATLIPGIMRMASKIKDLPGEKKKQFCVETVWLVYRAVDTYPDGSGNNINIPFVFGRFEIALERKFIEFGTEVAVEALYPLLKKSGDV